MRVAIIYNAVSDDRDPSELDILSQVRLVGEALDVLGIKNTAIPVTRALGDLLNSLEKSGSDAVFNLVESVDGEDELHPDIAAVLELIGLPFTGSSARGLWLTTDKIMAKDIMRARGIPTPDSVAYHGRSLPFGLAKSLKDGGPWIIKPATKDASIGIDEGSILSSIGDIIKELPLRWKKFGLGPLLVEKYIHGREFNISMLADPCGVECLPPAEILFYNYPEGCPRIVDWQAKWDISARSYRDTVRSFDFPPRDLPLLEELKNIAMACWDAFGLSGYMRVDMRVDEDNRPWVLEINANPCLSDDAGFMAAAREGGLSAEEVVKRILEAAIPL